MARIKYYALFDRVGGMYDPPFLSHNDGLACRAVLYNYNADPKGMLALRKADLVLYELGEFDDNSGAIIGLDHPRAVMNVGDLVTSQGVS